MTSKTSTEIAYRKIKDKILTCEYKPGQLISEKEIVDELGISRTPVREAISSLRGQSLLDIIPKKGIQISHLSIKKINEVYELRRVLEPLCIKYAMKYINEDHIETLYDLDGSLRNSIDKEDVLSLFKSGIDYHLYIAKISHNETLFKHLKMLRDESYRGLTYYLINYLEGCSPEEKEEILNLVGGEHTNITKAFEEKDEEKAIAAILEDLDGMNKVISKYS